MKLRVHYTYGQGKVKTKDFGEAVSLEDLKSMTNLISDNRESDYLMVFHDAKCPGFSVPAKNIVLMEVID